MTKALEERLTGAEAEASSVGVKLAVSEEMVGSAAAEATRALQEALGAQKQALAAAGAVSLPPVTLTATCHLLSLPPVTLTASCHLLSLPRVTVRTSQAAAEAAEATQAAARAELGAQRAEQGAQQANAKSDLAFGTVRSMRPCDPASCLLPLASCCPHHRLTSSSTRLSPLSPGALTALHPLVPSRPLHVTRR